MEDPGWPNVAKNAVLSLVPQIAIRRAQRSSGIEALRAAFDGFVFGVVVFGVVLAFLSLKHTDSSWTINKTLGVVFVVGIGGVSVAVAQHRKPLDTTSVTALAESYRKNFFLKVAFIETVALVAFVLSFLAGSHLVYPLGLAFTLVGFWIVAPGRRDVQRRTDQLQGTGLDLLVALRDLPPAPRGGRPSL